MNNTIQLNIPSINRLSNITKKACSAALKVKKDLDYINEKSPESITDDTDIRRVIEIADMLRAQELTEKKYEQNVSFLTRPLLLEQELKTFILQKWKRQKISFLKFKKHLIQISINPILITSHVSNSLCLRRIINFFKQIIRRVKVYFIKRSIEHKIDRTDTVKIKLNSKSKRYFNDELYYRFSFHWECDPRNPLPMANFSPVDIHHSDTNKLSRIQKLINMEKKGKQLFGLISFSKTKYEHHLEGYPWEELHLIFTTEELLK
jgi:hypothetical protein